MELSQYFSNDIATSNTGDLLLSDGSIRGQQRILRRLLTNPGDYIFHPTYGAGLPAMVGNTLNVGAIRALIRGQILLEDAVAKTPAPVILVNPIANGVSVSIKYNDAVTGAPFTLSFNVNR